MPVFFIAEPWAVASIGRTSAESVRIFPSGTKSRIQNFLITYQHEDMEWGAYLCRGAQPATLTSSSSASIAENQEDRSEIFEKLSGKIEQEFRNLGLNNFSSSVLKQYLIVSNVIGY